MVLKIKTHREGERHVPNNVERSSRLGFTTWYFNHLRDDGVLHVFVYA